MDIFSIAVTLFLIMDPLGNTPVFLSILKDIDEKRRRKILVRELLFALAILMIFFTGMLKTIRSADTHPKVRMLLCGLFSGFVGCCVNDFFTFSTVSVSITFWSLIGIGYAVQSFKKNETIEHVS